MSNKYVFNRYELKFKLTISQFNAIEELIKQHMIPDENGQSTIQSLYYDTNSYLLIRNSLEKPIYKEKIRLRSYGLAKENQNVFLELKKKYQEVVFKRRISLPLNKVDDFFNLDDNTYFQSQIGKEIIYFKNFYKTLHPTILLLYDRTAFYQKNSDLRITFDQNIRYRTEKLSLSESLKGIPLLDEPIVLMEIKTSYAFPLWLTKYLSFHHIYKQSFSKYGEAYKKINNLVREKVYVVS